MDKLTKIFQWIGLVLILIVGSIHVIDAKDSFSDAVYKGWLFYANGFVAVIAAYGIYRHYQWSWDLGLMVAIGSLGGYVASRTIGLPFIPAEPDNWFEPLGVAAMITEASFMGLYLVRRLSKT